MSKIKHKLIFISYLFMMFFSFFYLVEHIFSLLAVLNYEPGEKIIYLYNGYENLFIFRLLKNVMPLGTSVEIKFTTILEGIVYVFSSLGIVEILFLLFIIYLVFFNNFIEENQKDIVGIYNALMTLFTSFLFTIVIYIILFLLSVIFLKILYDTAFIIITIVLISLIILHLFISAKSIYKFIKFLKFRKVA